MANGKVAAAATGVVPWPEGREGNSRCIVTLETQVIDSIGQ